MIGSEEALTYLVQDNSRNGCDAESDPRNLRSCREDVGGFTEVHTSGGKGMADLASRVAKGCRGKVDERIGQKLKSVADASEESPGLKRHEAADGI